MKKRFVLIGILAVVVVAGGRWACDTTIHDQQLIDHLVQSATWWFPDAERPAIQRVHAAQTRTGRMGARQEHLYVEFARPMDLERFIADATRKLDEADAKQPGRWKWKLTRDVKLYRAQPSDEAPSWWPGPGRADFLLSLDEGVTLIALAGSDRIFIQYFVP